MINFIKKVIFLYDAILPKPLVNFRGKIFQTVRNFWKTPVIKSDKIVNYQEKGKHVFFGYYDVTPFSKDYKTILAMRAPLIKRAPAVNDEAEVGFYHVNDLEQGFISLGKTNTWCWQQGCRLQWYSNDKNQIIYNCLIKGQYGAIIKEVPNGKTLKVIDKPLYSISRDAKWGLSLDFSRLQRLRPGYGYEILSDVSAKDLRPDYNGIELVNLETGEWRQLFSLKEISEIKPHDSMKDTEHYFNHLMFNPSGNKFLFFHLWNENTKRHSRLFVCDRNGSNLKLLNNSGSISHYNWISDNEIILYSLIKEKNKYMYALFDSSTGRIRYFGKNIPKDDGHPTFLKNNNIFITDTYPDICFQRNLLSYNIKKDRTKVLSKFSSPVQFSGQFRCDLHPRINHNENMICVDRFVNNKRSISVIPVKIDEL